MQRDASARTGGIGQRDASQAFAFVGAAIVLSSLFIGIETELAVPGEPRRTMFILFEKGTLGWRTSSNDKWTENERVDGKCTVSVVNAVRVPSPSLAS